MINLAVVTNSIPNEGMPLPFISYGGSTLVMTLGALGILVNIALQTYSRACKPDTRPPSRIRTVPLSRCHLVTLAPSDGVRAG